MNLDNNTTSLQEILETVNNLPSASGGGSQTYSVTVIVDGVTKSVTDYEVGTPVTVGIVEEYGALLDSSVTLEDGTNPILYMHTPMVSNVNNTYTKTLSAVSTAYFFMPNQNVTFDLITD